MLSMATMEGQYGSSIKRIISRQSDLRLINFLEDNFALAPTVCHNMMVKGELDITKTPVPSASSDHAAIKVFANHGRWLTKCPFCNSAQTASDTDRRFYCANCLNNHAHHMYIEIEWPDNAEDIELVLMKRSPMNRNWNPGETVDDLRAENIAHEVI